jgi:DNA invertase Pin-like site-specific DNA recombinase
MSLTVAVDLPAQDRAELVRWTRTPPLRARLVQRARIVLLADEGVGTNEIVERVGVSKPTVIGWKNHLDQARRRHPRQGDRQSTFIVHMTLGTVPTSSL